MKNALSLFAALLFSVSASAQEIPADTLPALPEHVYCEIITPHLPVYRKDGVLFDFGQKTDAWEYNWMTDAAGHRLLFSSGVEALNYMICRGWEFVQAYTSGEDTRQTHYLLRIATTRLTQEQRTALLTPPEKVSPKKAKLHK